MTTRDHLVHHLQELYAFHRDFLPLLDEMRHDTVDARLRRVLETQHTGMKSGMETLERALNLLGAQYKQERNPLIPGVRESTQRFKHQMNPSREQADIHAALTMITVVQLVSGAYQGDIELAHAIGEQDVAMLLEENLHRESDGIKELREVGFTLVREISESESRRAA